MVEWKGDDPPHPFSYMNSDVCVKAHEQLPCYTTTTKPHIGKYITGLLFFYVFDCLYGY